MLKLYSLLVLCLFGPQTQVLSKLETETILKSSVLLHIKWAVPDEKTDEVKKVLVGCSGTFITPDQVLTAGHCFQYQATNVWIKDSAGRKYTAYVLKVDPDHDLALLKIEKANHAYARLTKSIRVGERVLVVGSPLQFQFLVSEGIVALLNHKERGFKSLYTIHTGMINSGSSGGGAFNENGELMGVNTMTAGGFFGWAGISMAVSIEDIRRFLQ